MVADVGCTSAIAGTAAEMATQTDGDTDSNQRARRLLYYTVLIVRGDSDGAEMLLDPNISHAQALVTGMYT